MARLMLRLGTECNSACAHCTLVDIPPGRSQSPDQALAEMARARLHGSDEVVFMRGEPTLHPELPRLAHAARRLGYRLVQIQTNGRRLCYRPYLEHLVRAGVDFFEVSVFGASASTHDAIALDPGAFDQTMAGLAHIAQLGAEPSTPIGHLVTIPVLQQNLEELEAAVELLASLGLRRVQLNFPRPILEQQRWRASGIVTLDRAGPRIRGALARARALGLATSTEAVPLCHLDVTARETAERPADFVDVRVVDVHMRHDDFFAQHHAQRPKPPGCRDCAVTERCASTWAAYQETFGTRELRPLDRPDAPPPPPPATG